MGKPQLHLWEPTLQTLANQTMKDFEYIVVDIFYEERPDYFKEHNYGLQIKHIPAAPGIWHDLGICEICHQFNKGLIHADGELLFFCADSNMHPPNLFESLWKHYKEDGYFVSLGFGADVSYGPKELQDTARTTIVPTEYYRFLDFHGHVHIDHRYNSLFENSDRQWAAIPSNWYYGISTASLEAMLKINGFDEAFDGDGALNDIDVGNRLNMVGYRKLAMYRECYTIEAYAGTGWHPKMRRPEIKCNNALLWYNKFCGRYRANDPITPSDIEWIITHICYGKCEVKDKCRTLPHRGPFHNKNEPQLWEHWKKHGAPFKIDLELEREMRKSGEAYQEGTFIGV